MLYEDLLNDVLAAARKITISKPPLIHQYTSLCLSTWKLARYLNQTYGIQPNEFKLVINFEDALSSFFKLDRARPFKEEYDVVEMLSRASFKELKRIKNAEKEEYIVGAKTSVSNILYLNGYTSLGHKALATKYKTLTEAINARQAVSSKYGSYWTWNIERV